MKKIDELSYHSFPDTKLIPDGYDSKTVPDLSAVNIRIIVDKLNEVIETVNSLIDTNVINLMKQVQKNNRE